MENQLSEVGKYYIRKYDMLYADRQNWQSNWEQIARYTQPDKDDVFTNPNRGEQKRNRLYDSTTIQANKLLASALHGMLTSPSSRWFSLTHPDKEISENHEAKLWLEDATNRMVKVLNNSNFQSQIHEVYLDVCGVSTATLFMGEDKDRVVYFRARPIYNFVIEEDHNGIVDTVGQCREYTAKELIGEFGEENVPEYIRELSISNMTRKYDVIHFIEPNKDYMVDAPAVKTNKPIRSIHIMKKCGTVLKSDGFNTMPYSIPRWAKYAGEKYGRGPGWDTLPDAKMLNAMMKVYIRAAQKAVDPPMVVPDNGFALPLDTRPGGSIYKRAGIQDEIKPLVSGARVDISEAVMESFRLRIRQAFYIDQLQLVQQNNMTATEVMQRTEENLRLMGPVFGRLNEELLKPIVDRLFDIMFRKNLFLPVPEVLKGKDIEIEYVSQIAKAQKTGEADTLNRVIQSMMPLIQANPAIMDNFDGDGALRHHADMFGLPEKLLLSKEDVKQMREDRQAAQEDMQEAELQRTEAETLDRAASAEMKQAQAQAQ